MTMTDQYLSQQKFDELTEELTMLKTVKRKEVADKLAYAKSLGDLSENAEYHDARAAFGNLEERIAKLEGVLKFAVITEDHHSNIAEIGSTVLLQKDGMNESERLTIVGSEEADFDQRKISNESPLGSAVLGKTSGEVFTVDTPQGRMHYKVLDIE
ncbi:MAG: transcription elongation factor GreA [bacterium]|nr:transcription elongation factor GreA [bacterium]